MDGKGIYIYIYIFFLRDLFKILLKWAQISRLDFEISIKKTP